MKAVAIVDTSIFCEFLNIPNMNNSREEVLNKFEMLLNDETSFLLPMAAVYETGNHIAQLSDRHRLLTIATNLAYPTVGSGMRQLRSIVTNTQIPGPLRTYRAHRTAKTRGGARPEKSGRDDKRPVTGEMQSFW